MGRSAHVPGHEITTEMSSQTPCDGNGLLAPKVKSDLLKFFLNSLNDGKQISQKSFEINLADTSGSKEKPDLILRDLIVDLNSSYYICPPNPRWDPVAAGLLQRASDEPPLNSANAWGYYKYSFSQNTHHFDFTVQALHGALLLKKIGVRCHASTVNVNARLDRLSVFNVIRCFGEVPEVILLADGAFLSRPLQAETHEQEYVCPLKLFWNDEASFTNRIFTEIDKKWIPLLRGVTTETPITLMIGVDDDMSPIGFVTDFSLEAVKRDLGAKISSFFEHSLFPGCPDGMKISLQCLHSTVQIDDGQKLYARNEPVGYDQNDAFKSACSKHIKNGIFYGICHHGTRNDRFDLVTMKPPEKETYQEVDPVKVRMRSRVIFKMRISLAEVNETTNVWNKESLHCLRRHIDGFSSQYLKVAMDSFLRVRHSDSDSCMELQQLLSGQLFDRVLLHNGESECSELIDALDSEINVAEEHSREPVCNQSVYFVYIPENVSKQKRNHIVDFVRNIHGSHSLFVLVSNCGDELCRFLDLVSNVNIREIVSVSALEQLCQKRSWVSDVPTETSLSTTHEVLAEALDQWLRNGNPIDWRLMTKFPVRTQDSTRLLRKISSLFSSNVCGVTRLNVHKLTTSAGATTLLRCVSFHIQQNFTNCIVIIRGTRAEKLQRICDCTQKPGLQYVLVLDENVELREKDVKQLREQGNSVVVILNVNTGFKPIESDSWYVNPFVDIQNVEAVIATLKEYYSDAATSLDALQARIEAQPEDFHERHVHNIVVTALCDMSVPMEKWIAEEIETNKKSKKMKQLLPLCAFATLFGDYLPLVLLSDSGSEADVVLKISEMQVKKLCERRHGLFVRRLHNGRICGLKFWSKAVALLVLFNEFKNGRTRQWEEFLVTMLERWSTNCKVAAVRKADVLWNLDKILFNREEDDFSLLVSLFARQLSYQTFKKCVQQVNGTWNTGDQAINREIATNILLSRAVRRFAIVQSSDYTDCVDLAMVATRKAKGGSKDRLARSNLGTAFMFKRKSIKTARSIFESLLLEAKKSGDLGEQDRYERKLQMLAGNFVDFGPKKKPAVVPQHFLETKWALMFPTSSKRNKSCLHPAALDI
eukprot:m.10458 g.10458  ORF g.10458 m.10458 type:complete len:1104 (+) comp7495_c0_seq1:109-3420(+)